MISAEPLAAASLPTRSSSTEPTPSKRNASLEKTVNSAVVVVEGVKDEVAVVEGHEADYPEGGLKAWLVVVGVCPGSIEG